MDSFLQKHKRVILPSLIILLFGFRLIYGLCCEFWLEDEIQVYAIGLKFFSTGHFPYFGPDIVYTGSQIPGALQGLLVGLPFYIMPFPEAPYIVLNLLSMAALCLFGFYLEKKFPGVPYWFTWIWICICPWAINFSTYVINVSYVMFGAILFFVAFFESIPKLSVGFLKLRTAFFLMGFSLFWIYQIHMSWVLMLPFIAAAFWFGFRKDKAIVFYFLTGCILTAALVIPTYIRYGFHAGSGGVQSNIVFNASNLQEIGNLIMRLISYATFELWHFISFQGRPPMEFFMNRWWAAPFMFFVIGIGVAQWVYLLISFFLKNKSPEFSWIRIIILLTVLLTFCSFLFSIKAPSSHTFYLLFPLMMIYSFYCWQPLFARKWFRIMMILMLFSAFITYATLAQYNYDFKSMYSNRERPLKAIQQKDYKILINRRAYDRNE